MNIKTCKVCWKSFSTTLSPDPEKKVCVACFIKAYHKGKAYVKEKELPIKICKVCGCQLVPMFGKERCCINSCSYKTESPLPEIQNILPAPKMKPPRVTTSAEQKIEAIKKIITDAVSTPIAWDEKEQQDKVIELYQKQLDNFIDSPVSIEGSDKKYKITGWEVSPTVSEKEGTFNVSTRLIIKEED